MPQFAANLTMLFNEHPFMERFEKAAKSGFQAVEFLLPYAYSVHEIRQQLEGDWDAGERGIACLPNRMEEFRASVTKAIEYATVLGVNQLNCLAGKSTEGIDVGLLRTTFVANLKYAAAELKKFRYP